VVLLTTMVVAAIVVVMIPILVVNTVVDLIIPGRATARTPEKRSRTTAEQTTPEVVE
jgi:hypothetical protein